MSVNNQKIFFFIFLVVFLIIISVSAYFLLGRPFEACDLEVEVIKTADVARLCLTAPSYTNPRGTFGVQLKNQGSRIDSWLLIITGDMNTFKYEYFYPLESKSEKTYFFNFRDIGTQVRKISLEGKVINETCTLLLEWDVNQIKDDCKKGTWANLMPQP